MKLDERGKQCPLPVIETKKALEAAAFGEIVEILVDNEIAVQNLKKLAVHKKLKFRSEKTGDREFKVEIEAKGQNSGQAAEEKPAAGIVENTEENEVCYGDTRKKGMVVVLSSDEMGQGDSVLGKLLMKGFIYALTKQDMLPETVLLYNGGARLSCEGSDSLEDLKLLEAEGVEILTCGTCLNHYGISDKLAVGAVTNMYEIAEKMTGAKLLVKP